MNYRFMRVTVTIAAPVLVFAHRYLSWFGTKDQFEIALLVIAALPWLGTVFKSVDIPDARKPQN
jgi:hypothetical protein